MAAGHEKLASIALRDATDTLDMRPGEQLTMGRLGTKDKRGWLEQAWPAVRDIVRRPLDLAKAGWGMNIRAVAEAAQSVRQDSLTDGMKRLLDHDIERGLLHDEGLSLGYLGGNAGSRMAVMHLDGRAIEAVKQIIAILRLGWTGSGVMLPCARNSWTAHNTAAVMLGKTHDLPSPPGPNWWRYYPAGTAGAIFRKLSTSTRNDLLSAKEPRLSRVRLHQPITIYGLEGGQLLLVIHNLLSYDNWTGAVITGAWIRLGTPFTLLSPGPGEKRRLGWYPRGPIQTRIEGEKVVCTSPNSRYGSPAGDLSPERYEASIPPLTGESWTIGGPGSITIPTGDPEPELDDTPDTDDEPKGWNVEMQVWVGRDKADSEDEAWEWTRRKLLNEFGRAHIKRG